ncbi:MAG: prolyl oligopeptidase family serine peptidase [Bacillota bacterium]
MAIIFRCDNCGHRYNVLDHMAGKRVRCKDCGQAILVPMPQEKATQKTGGGSTRNADDPRQSGQSSTSFKAIADSLADTKRGGSGVSKRPVLRPQRPEPEAYDLAQVDTDAGGGSLLSVLLRRIGWSGGVALVLLAVLAIGLVVYWRPIMEAVGGLGGNAPEFGTWTTISNIPRPNFPDLPRLQPCAEGLGACNVTLAGKGGPGHGMKLRIYQPLGVYGPGSLPCVLMASSGTSLLAGSLLSEDDADVALAYARKGFVVVCYELDGAPPSDFRKMNGDSVRAVRRFMEARAGLVNARNALEYVLAKLPQVDPERICAAGDGSSATVALVFAAVSGRVKGCIVHGPICDIPGYVDTRLMQSVERKIANAKKFFSQASPSSHVTDLQCPVYVFCAEDDNQVAIADVRTFVEGLKTADKQVEFVSVPKGGHRDAMLAEGIPDAVQWLRGVRSAAAEGKVVPEELVFQEPPAEPFWLPEPQVVDQLAAEVSIGDYRIRPPKGLTLQRRTEKSRSSLTWQAEGDNEGASFAVRILPQKNAFQRQAWVISQGTPGPFDQLYSILAPGGTVTRGRVGEIGFTSVVWNETDSQNRKIKRVELAGLDGEQWIVIQGRCAETNDELLRVLTSAAKTLRKPLSSEPYVDPFGSR